MKTLKKLENILPEHLYYDVKQLINSYAKQRYDYFAIPIDSWEVVVVRFINEILKNKLDETTFIGELGRKMNFFIKNKFLRDIDESNVRIFNNLAMKINNQRFGNENSVKAYIREFEILDIKFSKSIYNFLFKESKEFQKMVKRLNLILYTYEELLKNLKYNSKANQSDSKKSTSPKAKKSTSKKNSTNKEKKTLRKRKDLYSRFEDYEFITVIEKKIIIDYFVDKLPIDKRNLVRKCTENDEMNTLEIKRVNVIIGNLKVSYVRFINSGYLPEDNPILKEIYMNIIKRKNKNTNSTIPDESNIYELEYSFDLERKKLFNEQIKILEFIYREKGHSKEDFSNLIAEIIKTVELYTFSSEEEYIKTIIEMIYERIKEKKRV